MLTALITIIFSILIIPFIILLFIFIFILSFISKIKKRPSYPKEKPKGTIEILPKEEDSEFDLRDKKVGKDKFRKL